MGKAEVKSGFRDPVRQLTSPHISRFLRDQQMLSQSSPGLNTAGLPAAGREPERR